MCGITITVLIYISTYVLFCFSLFVCFLFFYTQVLDARDVLKTWISEVEQLHNSNKWLLFFRIPKLLLLYKVLTYESCDVTRIHQEIGFLFQRDVTSRQELNKALQVSC